MRETSKTILCRLYDRTFAAHYFVSGGIDLGGGRLPPDYLHALIHG